MAGENQQGWSGKSLGGRLRHAFFYYLLRIVGLKPSKVVLFFVVLFYCLVPSVARRAKPYLKHRFANANFGCFLLHLLRLYWSFGVILLERAAAGILHRFESAAPEESYKTVQALLAEGNGMILLSAHVGSWQTSFAALGFGGRINLVQPRGAGVDVDKHFFEHAPATQESAASATAPGNELAVRIIDPEGPFGGMLEMNSALKQGEIVCLMGDRLMPQEKHLARVNFLGEPITLPTSPYLLAGATGAPLVVALSRRTKECSVECEVLSVLRISREEGRSASSIQTYAQEFATVLEGFVQKYPYQFFNFFDLWQGPQPSKQLNDKQLNED